MSAPTESSLLPQSGQRISTPDAWADTEFRRQLHRAIPRNYCRPTFLSDGAEDGDTQSQLPGDLDSLLEELALGRPKTWIVTGGPGSGKTSLAAAAAAALLDLDIVPVVLDSRVLARCQKDVELRALMESTCPDEIPVKLWRSRIKHGRCVVIIDGLNEIARQNQTVPVWQFVKATVEGGHQYSVLATMRHFPEEPQPSLARPMYLLDLAPLTGQQIAAYLQGVGLSSADADSLLGQGEDFYSNPLLLSLVADMLDRPAEGRPAAARPTGGMPTSRSGLLLQTMQRVRWGGRLTADEIAIERSGLQLESVMVAAAASVFSANRQAQTFTRRDVDGLLAPHWTDTAQRGAIIEAFLDTQMVVSRGDSAGSFQFAHPSFVDFGVALAFRNSELPPALSTSDLSQCLGDWVGLTADPEASVARLLGPQPEEVERTWWDAPYLVDLVVANRRVLSVETRSMLWRKIGVNFAGPRSLHQSGLIQALNPLPKWMITEAIELGMLSYQPEYMADAIGNGLRSRNLDLRKIRQTRRRTRNERFQANVSKREHAFAMARKLGADDHDRAGALRLLKTAMTAAAPEAAAQILTSIMRIGTADELPFCVSVLVGGEDEAVRIAAAEMLGLFGLAAEMEQLARSLADDRSPKVRASCALALGQRRIVAALDALAAALADSSEITRSGVARALGVLGDKRAVAPLVQRLETDHDYKVMAAIAWALGVLREPAATPALIIASTETSTAVRAEACRALGEIGDRSAVPALARRLADADGLVRRNAATAIGKLGDREGIPPLIEALSHVDEVTRAVVANAMSMLRDPRTIEPLMVALGDDYPYVRGAAAAALGRFPDRRIALRLNEVASHDPESAVRASAISSLGRIGNGRDLRLIEQVIRDPQAEPWLRAVATMAYSELTTETPNWLADIADSLKSTRDIEAEKLRGTIIFCIARQCNLGMIGWLESIVRSDQYVINRSAAISGLVRNGHGSARLLDTLLSDGEKALAAGRTISTAVYDTVSREIVRRSADSGEAEPEMITRLLDVVLESSVSSVLTYAITNNQKTDSPGMLRILEFMDRKVAAAMPDHHVRRTIHAAITMHRRRMKLDEDLVKLRSDPAALVALYHGQAEPVQSAPPSYPAAQEGDRVSGSHCDLLLITVNPIETQSLRAALTAFYGPPVLEHAAINSYWRFTGPGGLSVVHMRCGMGGSGTRGTYVQVGDALRDVGPSAVVATGVAWGRDMDKTPLGTVLVSTQVLDFERQRIGQDNAGRTSIITRGARTEASARLLNRFLMVDYSATEVSLMDGPLLSGEKLIDNPEFKQTLLELFPEAVGGEMEGVGVQSVCDRAGVDWLVVKGVCDFAENKGEDKQARQTLAATRAAEAVCAVLAQGGFDRPQ